MGVHTGDSITVAPAQTLSDVEYQRMRDAAFACIRRVGVETGGSNVQFALDPRTGEQVIIEMNPRVSRSSALASKATGFPIAKIAARLAVGYTLDEIPNDITRKTPASFEPTIDYVVTKVPRWAFEKLPGTSGVLGTQMQSVGEAMAIGRTFAESFQKGAALAGDRALRAERRPGRGRVRRARPTTSCWRGRPIPTPERPFARRGRAAARHRRSERVHEATGIDPWFLDQMLAIVEERAVLADRSPATHDPPALAAGQAPRVLRRPARLPVGRDPRPRCGPAAARGRGAGHVQDRRHLRGRVRGHDAVPLLARTRTPTRCGRPSAPRVVILGSGPNRIGQGIEFDYCCVHASFALRDAGYETVMVNCNPETVSTDYDTSDRLYFEPLTDEDVLNVIEAEQRRRAARRSVVVALGGQTPLKLAGLLPAELVAGTSPESIDRAEDRERWNALCAQLEIPQPPGGTATTLAEALAVTERVGFPVLVRPSYVLGGRAMRIVYDADELIEAMAGAGRLSARSGARAACRPSARCSSTASWRTPSRSTSTPSATPRARC